MECELNGRLIKLEEDGELYWWNTHTRGFKVINPRWIRFKQTIVKSGNKKYKTTEVKGHKFKVHRVIYYIHNQEWDIYDNSQSNFIDHIDNNGLNNNIENLRVATHQENMWNNKSKCYSVTKWNTYRVKLQRGEIRLTKTYKTEQEAIDAVVEFKLKYHQF
tara:strand:- start:886 stop:1368 length:483 start_codon:yes stop_codon:yes gene_type:complete